MLSSRRFSESTLILTLTLFFILGVGLFIFSSNVARIILPLIVPSTILAKTVETTKGAPIQKPFETKIEDLRGEVQAFKGWVVDQALKMLGIMVTGITLVVALISGIGALLAKTYIKDRIDGEIVRLDREVYSRGAGIDAYSFWRAGDLDRAIEFGERAVSLLPKDSARYFEEANNTAFYYAQKGLRSYRAMAIDLAEKLLAQFPKVKDLEWLNTYAFVVSVYYEGFPNPMATVQDAMKILQQDVLKGRNATESNKENAQQHLIQLRDVLASLSTQQPEVSSRNLSDHS